MSQKKAWVYVFYGHQLYEAFPWVPAQRDTPEGSLYYFPTAPYGDDDPCRWFNRDMTPILLEDVPKQLRTLVLLMGI